MKIVCGSCGAKYSIADEKVQGKVFKIRCKKCSNVIVVKGSSEDSEFGGGGNPAEWFVVIDGDQVGPITSVEVDSYFMSGQIEATTYVWKDGMSDWIHLSDVPDFAHLAASGMGAGALGGGGQGTAGPDEATNVVDASHYQRSANASDDNPTVAESVSSDFGYGSADPYGSSSDYGSSDYGGSDYGAASNGAQDDYGSGYGDSGFADSYSNEGSDYGYAASSVSEGSTDSGPSAALGGFSGVSSGGGDAGGGLFSAFDAPSEPQGGGDFMSFGSEAQSASSLSSGYGASGGGGAAVSATDDNMVGKRNENSVLFSLSSLDQVKAVPAESPMPNGGGMNGASNGGGGGVVEGSGLIDIQALASAHKDMSAPGAAPQVDPFAHGTMAMPALAPMGSHRSNKPLIIAAVVAGILLVSLVGAVGYLVLKDDTPQEKIVERVIVEKAVPVPEKVVEEDKKVDEVKTEADKAAEAIEKNEPPKETKKTDKKAIAAKKKDDKKEDKKVEEKKKPTPKESGVNSLLNKLDKKDRTEEKKPTEKKKPTSSGKTLSKTDVKNTIKRYSGRVANCAKTSNKKNLSGKIKVKFSIKPNGRVTGAKVASSKFAGTDVGRCVQKVVAGMKFPSSDASKNVPVTYPFIVR